MSWLVVEEGVLIQDVDGDLVLLNLATERYHALTGSARRFYDMSRAASNFKNAAEAISNDYGIDYQTAAVDLRDFIKALADRGLVSVKGSMSDVLSPDPQPPIAGSTTAD